MDNICLSGGAEGADLQFGFCAGWVGHSVIHWSFAKARTRAPDIEVVRLTDAQLIEADPYLERANITIGRHLPKNRPWIMNLLRRNWFQVKDSQSCYAVSTIKDGKVEGGTAWATQMFIDQYEGASCPCYVYDQSRSKWFVWQRDPVVTISKIDDPIVAAESGWKGHWRAIDVPPPPAGIYAGIGSRELLINGKTAIRNLYGYTPPLQADQAD